MVFCLNISQTSIDFGNRFRFPEVERLRFHLFPRRAVTVSSGKITKRISHLAPFNQMCVINVLYLLEINIDRMDGRTADQLAG